MSKKKRKPLIEMSKHSQYSLHAAIQDMEPLENIQKELEKVDHVEPKVVNGLLRLMEMALNSPNTSIHHWGRTVLRMILEKGTDVTQIDRIYGLAEIIDIPVLKLCIQQGMSIDIQGGEIETSMPDRAPLIMHLLRSASVHFHFMVVNPRMNPHQQATEAITKVFVIRYLLDHDVDLSIPNKKGFLPVHALSELMMNEHTRPIYDIIFERSDMNAQSNAGTTPLMTAVRPNIPRSPYNTLTPVQIIELYLAAGANPLLRDEDGFTARDYADNADPQVVALLKRKEREFQEQAQGAIVARTRNRQGAQVFPTAIAKRITNFLGGRRTRKNKKSLKRAKSRKSRKSRKG
jgi:hypothetical protein